MEDENIDHMRMIRELQNQKVPKEGPTTQVGLFPVVYN